MNLRKSILSTTIALGLAGVATAADNTATIDITGSTAFRASVHEAIRNILFPTNATSHDETFAYTGASLDLAAQAIFKGHLGSATGPVVTIRTAFSGSGSGIAALAAGTDIAYLPAATTTTEAGASGATGSESAAADLTLSDVFQSSTPTKTPSLVDAVVAILPFEFVVNEGGFTKGITNMTNQLFRVLYSNGSLPVSLFTGLVGDEDKTLYAAGRSSTSGTRISTLAETNYGINRGVKQYTATVDTATDTLNSVTFVNNAGFADGASMAAALVGKAGTIGGSLSYLVGYIGLEDAATAVAGGASAMTYNGFAYSATNVYEGAYTFWSYEHLYAKSANPANNVGTALTALKNELNVRPGPYGLDPDNMHVVRETDGADVGPNFL